MENEIFRAGNYTAKVVRCNTAIVGSGYDHLKPFRSGVAAVRRAGRWSCIDRRGNPVESPSDNGRKGIPEAGGEENR